MSPSRDASAHPPSGTSGASPPGGASGDVVRVVVADDNPIDRAEICRLLRLGSDRHYRLTETETGDATVRAVLHAPEGPPDCLLLDYYLPDADATQVLAALVAPDRGCVCPVVVLTDGSAGTAGREVLRAGAQDYLGKAWMTAESITRAVESATERFRMARELRDRESFYRQALESIPGMVFTTAPDGACDYVSEQWLDFTGVPASELLGSGWLQILHPDDQAWVSTAWQAVVEREGSFDAEYRLRRADGAYVWFVVRGHALRDAAGAICRWLGVAANVDELKRVEQALADADRRKDEFLATLAHELRNPLAPIRNGLELLRRGGLDEEVAARIQDMMERQLSHLVRLVDDLLDVSRISRGMMELEPRRVRVETIFGHAVETSRPLIDAGAHELTVRVPDEPAWVDGDLTRLAQVVGNLLNNAAKYTPRGGHIELSAEVAGGEVVIRVVDDGIGIEADMLPRVFDLFTQLDRTLDRARGGLGIGLSLVRQLVEMHGGSVVAQSPGLGRGSTFTVHLPLASAGKEAGACSPSASEPVPGRPARCGILVVDDNVDGAETLAMLLELSGHAVRTAHSGPVALELARACRPDVVFLDIGMPGMDGYEVARRLRADPDTAGAMLVAMTGWGSEEDERKSKEAGFDLHLTKPVDPAVVAEVVARRWVGADGAAGRA